MRYLLVRWAVLAVAIGLTDWLMSSFDIQGGLGGILVVAAVLGLVNALIRPIVMLLTCPLVMLTLGLFALVVNALMLSFTAWLLPSLITLDNFWATLIAGIIISLVSAGLLIFVHDESKW